MGWTDFESWGYSSFSYTPSSVYKSIDADGSTGGDSTAFGDTQGYRNLMETVNEILNNPNYKGNYLLFKNDGRRVTFWLLDFSTPSNGTKSFDEEGEAKNIQGIIGHTMSFERYLQKYGPQISASNYYFGSNNYSNGSFGWENSMKGIAAIEGGFSTIKNRGYYLNNELLRFNKNGAYKWSSWGTKMKNGASYWNNNFVKNARAAHLEKLKGISKFGAGLIVADIAMSGELKPSHGINVFMLSISGTGVGAAIGGIWFVADMGTGAVNYLNGNGFRTLSDVIDDNVAENYGRLELYNGLY